MLNPQLVLQPNPTRTLLSLPNPFINASQIGPLPHNPSRSSTSTGSFTTKKRNVRVGYKSKTIKAIGSITQESVKVKALVTVQRTVGGFLSNIGLTRGLDDITDLFGKSLLLEIVSAELDPKTGREKATVKGYARRNGQEEEEAKYEAEFTIPGDFGEIGAIFVENEHHKEMFIKDVVIDGLITGPLSMSCNSWVPSKFDNKRKRIFFSNKSYLPSETPSGLVSLREKELASIRGNGQGERKKGERIFDYDVYNDLGEPDSSDDLARPVLGGSKQYPYPRRCRTGRAPTKKDPKSESRNSYFYVPRDEEFSEVKELTFSAKTVYSVLHALVPSLEMALVDPDLGFPYFAEIDSLFDEGIELPPESKQKLGWQSILPRLVKAISETAGDVLRFETPQTMDRDRFFWLRDEEFARQTLAGLNPCMINLVTEWPLKSTLDPKVYGPPESAITSQMIEEEIKGFMTIDEAIEKKKLFILDYHDILLPYVKKVREIKGKTLYGSRALFFLTHDGTLRPLVIELTRPPMDGNPQWKQVFRPTWDATGVWLWRLAKCHVLAHDSGIHQLVSHWLRTHCATEPYIIAAHRHLSAMHPIYKLLHPHFRYTMEINALARQALINADGIIELSFAPGKYSIELSSVAYDQLWRFDHQALPKDLISRGMAVEDPTARHGLKLTIEDYPYANDGLEIWYAIKQWVTDYVTHYYPKASLVSSDKELQSWWSEIRNVGHADKKDEDWWPELKNQADLIEIVTTIAWVASGHHAAVNFGQYAYAGYFPNRPTIARLKIPTEEPVNDEEWKFFMEKPEGVLLSTFPSQIQATRVMAVLDVLSNHSPDEEYLGDIIEASWAEVPKIKAAFEQFQGRLKEIEGIIDERNATRKLKNRHGAGVVPYELLKPFSEAGVTGQGVPYSISI